MDRSNAANEGRRQVASENTTCVSLCEEWGWAGGRGRAGWGVERKIVCVAGLGASGLTCLSLRVCVCVRACVAYVVEQLFLPSELAYGESRRGEHIMPGYFRFKLGVI